MGSEREGYYEKAKEHTMTRTPTIAATVATECTGLWDFFVRFCFFIGYNSIACLWFG
jgi:hypothetical protein